MPPRQLLLVHITPTQANHQIHCEVNELINKTTFPAKAEAALTNAMETTTTSNDNT